jgi:hypothetical protein
MKTTRSGELVNADGSPWDGVSKPHSKATGLPVQTALLDQITTRQYATPTASNAVRSEAFREGRTLSPAEVAHVTGGRLNPRWVEWLMGFPIGWTSLDPLPPEAMEQWADPHWWLTDPADEGLIPRVSANEPNRAAQLKALGNAQVPLCAATAFSILAGTEASHA